MIFRVKMELFLLLTTEEESRPPRSTGLKKKTALAGFYMPNIPRGGSGGIFSYLTGKNVL